MALIKTKGTWLHKQKHSTKEAVELSAVECCAQCTAWSLALEGVL